MHRDSGALLQRICSVTTELVENFICKSNCFCVEFKWSVFHLAVAITSLLMYRNFFTSSCGPERKKYFPSLLDVSSVARYKGKETFICLVKGYAGNVVPISTRIKIRIFYFINCFSVYNCTKGNKKILLPKKVFIIFYLSPCLLVSRRSYN